MHHTPTPFRAIYLESFKAWHINGQAEIVCVCNPLKPELTAANAEFIVRACNCHKELYEALRVLVAVYFNPNLEGIEHDALARARAAIAKAEGRI